MKLCLVSIGAAGARYFEYLAKRPFLFYFKKYVNIIFRPQVSLQSIKCNSVILSYLSYNYMYTNCIFVIRRPDDGHKSDRNMVKNNCMSLNIFMNMHLLVHHVPL